jgi:pyruvate ferredoxin oxidoreductase delta subunit
VDGVPVIDLKYCKGCGICAYECTAECIEMVKEGTG